MVLPLMAQRSFGLGRLALGLAALSFGAAACGGAPPKKPAVVTPGRPSAPVPPPPSGPPVLPSFVVADVAEETASFFARHGDLGLVVFPTAGKLRAQLVGLADETPVSKGGAVDLADVTSEVTIASVSAVGAGFVVAWLEDVQQNRVIRAIKLDAAGKPEGPAQNVAQTTDDVAFVEVLPNATGALVLWEILRGGASDVFVSPFGAKAGAGTSVGRGLDGWQVVPTEKGAALAMVQLPSGEPAPAVRKGPKKKGPEKPKAEPPPTMGPRLGHVSLVEIDATGKPAAPVRLTDAPTAEVDVELVALAGKTLVAWTDRAELDAAVVLAGVGAGGAVEKPKRVIAPIGDQALVALVAERFAPGKKLAPRALLAWEDLRLPQRDGRTLHLATLGADGGLGAERAHLSLLSSGVPDLVADGDGFAALTLSTVAGAAAPPPEEGQETPIWPQYVRFGPDLAVRAAEPVRAEPFRANELVPYLVRGLSCGGGRCTALATGWGERAPLTLVALPVRESGWEASGQRRAPQTRPLAQSITSLYAGDHVARVAALEGPTGTTVAWVTYVLAGAEEKKGEEVEATLATRVVTPTGLGATQILSKKAVSFGGVALASLPPARPTDKEPDTVLAWVARERGEAQVYVTKLGATGDKRDQKKLTMVPRKVKKGAAPSEASEVAIAAVGEGATAGFIVAWIDSRDGNGEVYVARLDRQLKKIVPDKRITNAPGDAAEVQLAVRGGEVALAWSDARDSGDEGAADVFLVRLDAAKLDKKGTEQKVFASKAHSRGVALSAIERGWVVGWIEEPADEGAQATARLAEVAGDGALASTIQVLRGDGQGSATSVSLACQKLACRGLVGESRGEALFLGAFTWAPGAVSPITRLAALSGPPTQDLAPALAGPSVALAAFGDDARDGGGRVRLAKLLW